MIVKNLDISILIFNCLHMIEIIKEFFKFVLERKKYYLIPVIFLLALFGVIIILGEGSAIAPFIYAIF